MEYLDGETVAQRLEKGALPLDQALTVAIEIADALDKAHRQGIVHRDLKPANIMLTKAGAKLLDFGLAKLKPPEQAGGLSALPTQPANLTQQGAILGTFQYMAPEQLEGQEADARTDIFAFGAVVYEMVTGTKAFEGKSQASLIGAIMSSDPPSLGSLQPTASARLDELVKKCLAKDRTERWQAAADIRVALQWETEGAARPVPQASRRQDRRVWMVAAAVVVAGVAILTWALLRTGPSGQGEAVESPSPAGVASVSDTRPALAVLPLANRGGTDEDRHFTDGVHDELRTNLSRIAGLRVVSRGSVEEYRDTPKGAREIGDDLAARGESRSYEGSTQSIRRTTLTRMAMGTRETDQPPLWIATSDLPTSPGHPFYARLTTLLDGHHFDRFVEGLCDRFYAPVMGRPSLAPGRYFRLLLVGYFEGIDSERGMAWRATDSLAVRSFLRLAVDEAPPDHSTIARTRRLIDLETHRTVFTWVQQRLVEAGRLKGKTLAIDATTLEANAAMRSIVRRDTGESYQAFLAGLATASGIETPTREGLARLDRKRKKKTSNTDWTNPHDPDAKVTKMKDGRTHLAHKAEHAVDMETGAIVAVTLQGADVGDTTTIIETAIAATEQVEDAQANVDDRQSLEEIVGDKGYHSNQTLIDLDAGGIRSYVSEPDRGRRDWSKDPAARAPVYGNRRRMRGRRGRRLMRQRGERIERSFAHLYDTGGMRRTHLRGHTNILKRLLIHAGGFNLGLVMRHLIGIGTPRGLQGRVAAVRATLGVLMGVVRRRLTTISSSHRLIPAVRGRLASLATFAVNSSAAITCTTGC